MTIEIEKEVKVIDETRIKQLVQQIQHNVTLNQMEKNCELQRKLERHQQKNHMPLKGNGRLIY